MTVTGRPSRFTLAFLVAIAAFAFIGVATAHAACSTNDCILNASAPPISNWTDTSGAVWSPAGGFPGCAPGDTASAILNPPTNLVIDGGAIPYPIGRLQLAGCEIDIGAFGSLTLAGTGNFASFSLGAGGTLTLQNGADLTI